jgi:hypothetical protein
MKLLPVSYLLFILILIGCNMQTGKYIRQCKNFLKSQNDTTGYLSVESVELKKNLPKTTPLFYVGTDENSHYFVYYYDKKIKTSIGFKIKLDQYNPSKIILFSTDNYYLKKYPVYSSDF